MALFLATIWEFGGSRARGVLAITFGVAAISAQADPIIGPWVPKFKGVDHSVSTNLPSGGDFPNRHVVHALRVDLTDPDVRLFTTPRHSDYVASVREIGALTVSDFLKTYRLQAAINANFFSGRNYYLPAGTPMDVYGLSVSEGVVVSDQEGRDHAAAIVFDADNRPNVIHTNWPAISTDGIFTAVAGNYPLVIAGKNIVPRATARETEPRTVFGVSANRRYLYLVAIDGRQPGYSNGANDYESAGWLLLLGAHDGINMDGGGSTTMVIEDSTGVPVRLNRSSAVADSGRERTVGSHLGLFAKPAPGFINDVVITPDDTTAKIAWTTLEASTSQLEYGVTTEYGNRTVISSVPVTSHVAQLGGLTPKTGYYMRILSSVGAQEYISPVYFFFTTNYVTTNRVFGITNSWKYAFGNLNGADWTSPSYNDEAWTGPGPGLLWADIRAAGPNAAVEPESTEVPVDANLGGYPYVTYYFRAQFDLPELAPGSALAFSGYIDDGAVFYINGVEVYRLRMPANAAANTLASGFPCEGDATCLDQFSIPIDSIRSLKAGDNVLAVEVHNYNLRSADMTFGVSLDRIEPVPRSAKLDIQYSSGAITVTWPGAGFILQNAHAIEGPWVDVAGGTVSPFTAAPEASNKYYRLRR